jgi:hypothetical protein
MSDPGLLGGLASRDEHRPLSARLLGALAASGEALTLLHLADLAEAPAKADCSAAIRRMEMHGYVQRTPGSRRRSLSWHITEAGRERLARGGFKAPRGEFSHGTRAGYGIYGCRCERCRAWEHDNYQEQRKAHPPGPESEAAHSRVWRAENPEKAAAARAKGHAAQQRKNAALRDVASRHGQEWTGTDLEMASRADMTAEQVARVIGRTIRSVTSMREELRSSDPRNRMLRDGTPPTSRSHPSGGRPDLITGTTYLERGQPVRVITRWGPGGGPRNVLIERADASRVVRPFRGLRRPRT